MLLIAGPHVHVFVWAPQLGADSYGISLRHRWRDNAWIHYRLLLCQRNVRRNSRRHSGRTGQRFRARPPLTLFEFDQWRTRDGIRDRDGLKRYVRLKIGPGGRQLHDSEAA
jgi:hypothetical protein